MKAKFENGQIKFYAVLPNRYRSENLNIAGGFNKLPKAIHEAEGFLDVVTPEILDPAIEKLGKPYMDYGKKICTYPVEAIVLNIEEVRASKRKYFTDNFNSITTVISQAQYAIEPGDAETEASFNEAVGIARQFKVDAMAFINNENDAQKLVKFKVLPEHEALVLGLFEPFLS